MTRSAQGALGAAGQDWAGRLLSALVSDLAEPHGLRLEADALFEQKALLPKEWIHAGQSGRSFVVMPLCWKRESLGHVLLDFNLKHAFAYGALAEAIGSALHGADLAARSSESARGRFTPAS